MHQLADMAMPRRPAGRRGIVVALSVCELSHLTLECDLCLTLGDPGQDGACLRHLPPVGATLPPSPAVAHHCTPLPYSIGTACVTIGMRAGPM